MTPTVRATPFIYRASCHTVVEFILVHRAYNICPTCMSLDSEFNFLKQYFHNNGYAKDLVERSISKLLSSKFNPLNKQQINLTNLYFVFPYFGKQSENFKSAILI